MDEQEEEASSSGDSFDGEAVLELDADLEPEPVAEQPHANLGEDEALAAEAVEWPHRLFPVAGAARRLVRVVGLGGALAAGWGAGEESNSSSSDEEEAANVPLQVIDVQHAALHEYLFSEGCSDLQSPSAVEPGARLHLPFINIDVVLLPDQYLPLCTILPSYRTTILYAIQQKSFVAVLPILNEERENEYGTLFQINRYADDGDKVRVHGVGTNRFRLIEKHNEIDGTRTADVEVLSERVLRPLMHGVLRPRALSLPRKRKLELAAHTLNVPKWVIDGEETERKCDELVAWMRTWFTDDRVKNALEMGLVGFSFFCAANVPVGLSTKIRFLQENCTDRRIADLHAIVTKMRDIVCNHCGTELCQTHDIINLTAEGNSSHFVNDHGYVHEIITVSSARNFTSRGRPQSRFSWFDGYKWQIIECSMCMEHLGWEYTSKRFEPAKFYGFTRRSVAPKQLPQNQ